MTSFSPKVGHGTTLNPTCQPLIESHQQIIVAISVISRERSIHTRIAVFDRLLHYCFDFRVVFTLE